jgi:hypothetical protein
MAESNCNCARVSGLPATIAPGASVDLPVEVSVGSRAGEFRVAARLRTSAGDVGFRITGRVTADRSTPVVPTTLVTVKEGSR